MGLASGSALATDPQPDCEAGGSEKSNRQSSSEGLHPSLLRTFDVIEPNVSLL